MPSSASTDAWMLATSGFISGLARLRRQRRGEEAHRVQRLAQVVARRGEELALRAIRGLRGGARSFRGARLRGEQLDQVDVLVADRERVREHVVELPAERKHEHEHDAAARSP